MMGVRAAMPAILAAVCLWAGGGVAQDGAIYRPEIEPIGWSADGQRVLFVHSELYGGYDHARFECGGSGMYETDGRSPPRPLVTGGGWCEGAAGWLVDFTFSADGRTVFALPEHGFADCTVAAALELDTGRWREAARICGSHGSDPAISPDGSRIVLSLGCASMHGGGVAPRGCVDDDGDRLTVMALDGSGRRQVGEPGDQDPIWSPDGRRLAVRPRADEGGEHIAVIDLDTGRRHVVARGSGPVWSPEGRWLAFTRFPDAPDAPVTLHVARADGTDERTVFTQDAEDMRNGPQYPSPGGWPRDPLWSPDGRRIVFTKHFQTGNTLWIVNADGTGLRRLSERVEPSDREQVPCGRWP